MCFWSSPPNSFIIHSKITVVFQGKIGVCDPLSVNNNNLFIYFKIVIWLNSINSYFQIQICTCLFFTTSCAFTKPKAPFPQHALAHMPAHLRSCACGEVERVKGAGQHTDRDTLQHYTTVVVAVAGVATAVAGAAAAVVATSSSSNITQLWWQQQQQERQK